MSPSFINEKMVRLDDILFNVHTWMVSQGSLYITNPNNAQEMGEIPQNYHTFASSLITPKLVSFNDPLFVQIFAPRNNLRPCENRKALNIRTARTELLGG